MAKASDRKGLRADEYECCARLRARELDSIRRNYLSFPVIKTLHCPSCDMVLKIRVYSREDLEAATGS